MIRKNQRIINRLHVLTDALLELVSYLLASWLWLDVIRQNGGNMASVRNLGGRVWLVAVIYAAWTVVVFACLKVYRTTRVNHAGREDWAILIGNAIALITAAAGLFLFRLEDFSRGVLVLYYVISSAMLIGKRKIGRAMLRSARAKGYNLKHMLVVGGGDLARRYVESTQADPSLGIHVRECLPVDDALLEKLEEKLHGDAVDELILALEPSEVFITADVIRVSEKCGTKISIVPFYNDIIPTRPAIDVVGSIKLIQLRTTPMDEPLGAMAKRGFDIIVSAVLLILLSPLLLVLALLIKLSSPGPVLFKQERVGKNKKNFLMYKFRSMRVNSTQDTAWSGKTDDRRTFIGSLLRKTSLDELPQLINTLKGDMSLVGPRPEIPFYVEQFRETVPLYMVKYQVRPGMTGWAQVHGLRGDTSIPDRVEHDLWYIENWTFGLDLKILFKTAFGGMVNAEKVR